MKRRMMWICLALLMACQQVPMVVGVSIAPDDPSLVWGDALPLTATVTVAGGADRAVSWSSSDAGIVSVSPTGVITGEKAGRATVTATSVFDTTKSDSVLVTVDPIAEEIAFWHTFGDDQRKNWIDARVEVFNAGLVASGIETRIVASVKPTYQAAFEDALQALLDGNAPHAVTLYEGATQRALDSGAFRSVHEVGGLDVALYLGPIIDYYTIDDRVASIPFTSAVPMLFANLDLVQAAGLNPDALPETFDEVIAACQAIDLSGLATPCMTFGLHAWFIEQWIAEQGALLVDNGNGREGRATEVQLDSEAALAAAQFVADLGAGGWYVHSGVREDFGGALAIFASAESVFMINSSAVIGYAVQMAADAGFVLGSGVLPIPDGAERQGVVPGGASVWLMDGHPKKELEIARDFVHFMTSTENSAEWHKLTGYLPVTVAAVDLLEEEGWFAENLHHALALQQLSATIPSAATAGALLGTFEETRSLVLDALESVLDGNVTVEVAMAVAKADADAVLWAYEDAR
jgi:sn-glycerol 3-phosphate transport system substrate-binding protein